MHVRLFIFCLHMDVVMLMMWRIVYGIVVCMFVVFRWCLCFMVFVFVLRVYVSFLFVCI
jgi:hypothetical protein